MICFKTFNFFQKNFRLIVLEPTTIAARQDETHTETFADVTFQCLPGKLFQVAMLRHRKREFSRVNGDYGEEKFSI